MGIDFRAIENYAIFQEDLSAAELVSYVFH